MYRVLQQLAEGEGKKLAGAAEHWARGPQADPEHLAAQLEAFGAPPEVVEEERRKEEERALFEIYPENETAVLAFIHLATQWRVVSGAMGGAIFLGLDYNSVRPVLWALDVPRARWREIFADLRIMEAAALPVLNARKDSSDG